MDEITASIKIPQSPFPLSGSIKTHFCYLFCYLFVQKKMSGYDQLKFLYFPHVVLGNLAEKQNLVLVPKLVSHRAKGNDETGLPTVRHCTDRKTDAACFWLL